MQPFFHQLAGAQQGAGLGLGFASFHFRVAVGHDAGGRLGVEPPALDDAGANGNSQVHVARVEWPRMLTCGPKGMTA